MNQINLEGEVFGYKKRTLALTACAVVLIGASFYAGAKYEKIKLSKLGLLVDKKVVAKEKKDKVKVQQSEPKEQEQPQTEAITGKITYKSAKGTLTISKSDNTKQEVVLNAETKIGENGTGNIAQLYVGQQITANGIKSSDGNFTLTEIKPVVAVKKTLTK